MAFTFFVVLAFNIFFFIIAVTAVTAAAATNAATTTTTVTTTAVAIGLCWNKQWTCVWKCWKTQKKVKKKDEQVQ